MMMDCEYCDGGGYVPCEECNDIPIQVVAKPIETPLEVHKKDSSRVRGSMGER